MDLKDLKKFLIESNQAGYAGGQEKKWIKESDSSTSIPYEKGDWRSHDNFFGGEPYGGRLVIFHKGKPVWIMVYYGWVSEGADINMIYSVLRKALIQMPEEAPFRGPRQLVEGKLIYTNNWGGDVKSYSGEEKITENGKTLYKANYMGGLVDKNAGI